MEQRTHKTTSTAIMQAHRIEELETENMRYREALERIGAANPAPVGKWLTDIQMAEIARAALTPQPEYREVEVVRWMKIKCGSIYTDRAMTDAAKDSGDYIKLTGTRRIPVRTVRRREEIKSCRGWNGQTDIPEDANIYAEWTEEVEG